MDKLYKWNLKIGNFLDENKVLGDNIKKCSKFIMTQIELYPRASFILVTFLIFLIIVTRPWILIVISLSFLTGFHSIDFLHDNLHKIITHIKRQQQFRVSGLSDNQDETRRMLDPLLNVDQEDSSNSRHEIPSSNRRKNVKESQNLTSNTTAGKSSLKAAAENSRLKINPRLDKSIAHFCSLVFDAYISPDWAPYETRKQLKLAFVKLLTHFAQRVLDTFAVCRDVETEHCYGVTFCRDKIIPLAFRHLKNDRKGQRLSPVKLKRALWKVRRLCRTLLEVQLSKDDQQCLLWMELCVSVLADGVIWNLILLGKDELPPLIEKVVREKLFIDHNANPSSSTSQTEQKESTTGVDECDSSKIKQDGKAQGNDNRFDETDGGVKSKVQIIVQETEKETSRKNLNTGASKAESTAEETDIPFLLDNFLDPSHDVEQAAMIVSRWRPTLNDILNERELLYALIQYLRGQKALEFLQAVLDDSPDGSEYCRKILELEYLPGFCRSKLFLENLGLNRIDEVGLEAGMESTTLKKPIGHTRSASYGTEREPMSGMKLWKIEQRVVDGIAIYNDKIPAVIPADEAGTVDVSDSIFKRRHVLESFITKFFSSVNHFGKPPDPLDKPVPARRLGIDFKEYDDLYHPDVMSSVQIEPCDVLAETTNLVSSWMYKVKWLRLISAGWMKLLHPFLKPKFDAYLDCQISALLSVDNFIQFVDLISEAFLESTLNSPLLVHVPHQTVNPTSANQDKPETCDKTLRAHSSNSSASSNSFAQRLNGILENVFDIKEIFSSLENNADEFILFFVDLLDILIAELTTSSDSTKSNTNLLMSMHSTSSASDNDLRS